MMQTITMKRQILWKHFSKVSTRAPKGALFLCVILLTHIKEVKTMYEVVRCTALFQK